MRYRGAKFNFADSALGSKVLIKIAETYYFLKVSGIVG